MRNEKIAANLSPNFSFIDDATLGPGIAEIEVETVLEQSKPKRKRSSTVSSEGESSSKRERNRKVLNKEQKRMILFCLCDAESNEVSSFFEAKVNSEKLYYPVLKKKCFEKAFNLVIFSWICSISLVKLLFRSTNLVTKESL